MKKHLFNMMAVAFVFLLVTACDKKTDTPAPSIIGSWKYTSGTGTNCTDPNNNYSETCTLTAPECGILVIASGTYTYTQTPSGGAPNIETGTYTTSGSSITVSGGGSPSTMTFAVTATTLTFTGTNSSSGCSETTVFTRQ